MKHGDKVLLQDDHEGVVSKTEDFGCWIYAPDLMGEQYVKNIDLRPLHVKQFCELQFNFVEEMYYFVREYGFLQNARNHTHLNFERKRFKPKDTVGVENVHTDECFMFKNHLMLVRPEDLLPYAFLKPMSTHEIKSWQNESANNESANNEKSGNMRVDKKKDCIFAKCVLHKRSKLKYWNNYLNSKMSDVILIKYEGEKYFFRNTRTQYSIDMGFMYLMLEVKPFSEGFVKNMLELVEFTLDSKHVYSASLGLIQYGSNDEENTTRRVVGFNCPSLHAWTVMRKMTFSWHRYNLMNSPNFATMHENFEKKEATIFLIPWTPMRFVHLQFVYAFHFLEFISEEKHCKFQAKKNRQFRMYKQLCGELLCHLERISNDKDYQNWEPSEAIKLLFSKKPTEGYLLSTTFMNDIYNSHLKQEAWLSNFQHLVTIYSNLMTNGLQTQYFLKESCIVNINGLFLSTFTIDPVMMQSVMIQEEYTVLKNMDFAKDIMLEEQKWISDKESFTINVDCFKCISVS